VTGGGAAAGAAACAVPGVLVAVFAVCAGAVLVAAAGAAARAVPCGRVVPVACEGAILAGEQGAEGAAVQQGEEHLGAELLESSVGSGVLQVAGGCVDVLVGGEDFSGGHVPPGE
jgi:hypothetical protein